MPWCIPLNDEATRVDRGPLKHRASDARLTQKPRRQAGRCATAEGLGRSPATKLARSTRSGHFTASVALDDPRKPARVFRSSRERGCQYGAVFAVLNAHTIRDRRGAGTERGRGCFRRGSRHRFDRGPNPDQIRKCLFWLQTRFLIFSIFFLEQKIRKLRPISNIYRGSICNQNRHFAYVWLRSGFPRFRTVWCAAGERRRWITLRTCSRKGFDREVPGRDRFVSSCRSFRAVRLLSRPRPSWGTGSSIRETRLTCL